MVNRTILFIKSVDGFIAQAITKNLKDAGFSVIEIPDFLEDINNHKTYADMILYYVSGSKNMISQRMTFLTDMCDEENKTLCLIGDESCVNEALNTEKDQRIVGAYKRPVDIRELVIGVKDQFNRHKEYDRTKSILLVDDDSDFISIATLWLESDYKVDGVCSGDEALRFLDKYRPDLILLDYDMPELDGYEVFERIQGSPLTAEIPVIFLTGKNDKESVMKIINKRPAGYLLKSLGKVELMNTIDSFFAERSLNVVRS